MAFRRPHRGPRPLAPDPNPDDGDAPQITAGDAPDAGNQPLTTADLMTPSPRSCSPFSTVTEVSLLFRDADCGAIPITEDGRVVGIVTDRDVALAAAAYPDLPVRPIGDFMTREVVTVRDDATVEEVERTFAEAKVRRLVVVDESAGVLGMISLSHLAARLPSAEVGQVVASMVDPKERDRIATPAANASPTHAGKERDTRSPWANLGAFWSLAVEAGREWVADKAPGLGAALAYYTAFSIAPLLLIAIAIAGLVFGREAAQGQIVGQLRNMLGQEGAEAIQTMIANASKPEAGYSATATGVVLLLIGATALFGQLQDAMNTVWEVQPKPGRGLWGLVKDRLLSLGMVMGTVFLLLVSLVASATLAAMSGLFGGWMAGVIGQVINFVVSLAVITGLFALIYRYLPDARIAWGDVWLGAAITSLLFVIGKTAIGLYIGRSAVSSTYGAAGSVVVLLIWAYYSSQSFLYGAEFTKAYANRFGSGIEPEEGAENLDAASRADQGTARGSSGAAAG